MAKITLLLIDPQNDFCDPNGSLYVTGAEHDMTRISALIDRLGTKITEIKCTLDSHPVALHIGNASFWVKSNGSPVDPFTLITPDMVAKGEVRARALTTQSWARIYVDTLAANGRYPLVAWPDHCIIGTNGTAIYPVVHTSLKQWAIKKGRNVDFIAKGSNWKTEHYSGVKADVPDPDDPGTQIDPNLIQALISSDQVLIAGEASSHCVANTVTDIANAFNDDYLVKKFVFLKDASSPVPSFEGLADTFERDMAARGMQIINCGDF